MKCHKCKQGYLVAEYSPSTEKTYYYCNNCYKYSDELENDGREVECIQEAMSFSSAWADITEEEIEQLLDTLFRD